jgi:serine/threonine protein kinase
MTPERWQQVKELFHSALERESNHRALFLDEACAGDVLLRREVEALIASHEQTGSFIDSPAYEVGAELLTEDQVETLVGQRIAHYEIVTLLGSGGMGEVYLAQDVKLGRSMALKLLPTFFTRDEDRLRRFEREARAASALNHPNVCVIYEVGETQDARPFIAMEFVEGQTWMPRSVGILLTQPRSLTSAFRSPTHWMKRTRKASRIATSNPLTS